jgi:hypothetical protein
MLFNKKLFSLLSHAVSCVCILATLIGVVVGVRMMEKFLFDCSHYEKYDLAKVA